MLRRHVERLEVVVVVLDLGTFQDLEAEAGEDLLDLLADDGQRMPVSERDLAAGPRDVDAACGQAAHRRGLGRRRSGPFGGLQFLRSCRGFVLRWIARCRRGRLGRGLAARRQRPLDLLLQSVGLPAEVPPCLGRRLRHGLEQGGDGAALATEVAVAKFLELVGRGHPVELGQERGPQVIDGRRRGHRVRPGLAQVPGERLTTLPRRAPPWPARRDGRTLPARGPRGRPAPCGRGRCRPA